MKRTIFVTTGLLLLSGCGSKKDTGGTLTGTVYYNGKPVNGASLLLHPTSGQGDDFSINVGQDGTFSGYNIPPGEYKIAVQSQEIPPDARQYMQMPKFPPNMDPAKKEEMKQKFQEKQGQEAPTIPYPKKYKDLKTTDLKCTVVQGKNPPLTLELKD